MRSFFIVYHQIARIHFFIIINCASPKRVLHHDDDACIFIATHETQYLVVYFSFRCVYVGAKVGGIKKMLLGVTEALNKG